MMNLLRKYKYKIITESQLFQREATLARERFERMSLMHQLITDMRSKNDFCVPNRKIAVVHLQKTGGTSLRDNLRVAFPDALHVDMGGAVVNRCEPQELKLFDVVFGHMQLDDIVKKLPDVFTVAFVRHPVTHAFSRWKWLRSYKDDPVLGKQQTVIAAAEHDFESYIQSTDFEVYEQRTNYQTYILMGKSVVDILASERADKRVIRELDESLKVEISDKIKTIGFLGVFENFESESECLLRLLGAKSIVSSAKLNVTGGPHQSEMVTPELSEKIIERNRLDMYLYEQALRLRESRLGVNV
jgi:hypothetical protein